MTPLRILPRAISPLLCYNAPLTLRQFVSKVMGLPVRTDTKARLLGYALFVYVGGWGGLNVSHDTEDRLRESFRKFGISPDDLEP